MEKGFTDDEAAAEFCCCCCCFGEGIIIITFTMKLIIYFIVLTKMGKSANTEKLEGRTLTVERK